MGLGVAGSVALGSAVLGAGTSLLGSSQSSGAASDAAGLQSQTAAANAARSQPYVNAGYNSANQLDSINSSGGFTAGQTDYLTGAAKLMPGQMTQASLEQTPGYQFQLSQAQQATQNSAAARGLGVSGAALKGAATYAAGLANSNYQTQFGNQQTQFQNALNLNTGQQTNDMNRYSQLAGVANLGQTAASGVSANQTTSAASQGNYLTAAGNASAAGTLGVGSAATGAANNYITSNMLQQAIGGGSTQASNDAQTAANGAAPFYQ